MTTITRMAFSRPKRDSNFEPYCLLLVEFETWQIRPLSHHGPIKERKTDRQTDRRTDRQERKKVNENEEQTTEERANAFSPIYEILGKL